MNTATGRALTFLLALPLAVSLGFSLSLGAAAPARAEPGPVKLVAAENFYGNIAHQVGGLLV
ncbi:MAG: hypothetical protein P8Y53_23165 [Pseudolabrys sp.]